MTVSANDLVQVQGQWVNLYTATGVTVGTEIIVQNFQSNAPVAITDSANEPGQLTGRIRLNDGEAWVIEDNSAGAWAYCSGSALISVQEA